MKKHCYFLNVLQEYFSETVCIISSAVGHFLFGFPFPFPFPLPFGFFARIRPKDYWLTKTKTKVRQLTQRSFMGHLCITSLHSSWRLLSQRRSSETHFHHLLPINTHSILLFLFCRFLWLAWLARLGLAWLQQNGYGS